jgi:hypothetical protein
MDCEVSFCATGVPHLVQKAFPGIIDDPQLVQNTVIPGTERER